MAPLVSIIIPVYNVESYIGECLESILGQTYRHIEILVIDDGCTDKSIKIIESCNDPVITIIRNAENLGLAASVNNAIRAARGLFLARMDGDDIAHKTRIEKQVNFLIQNPHVDIVGTAMQSFGDSHYLHQFPTTHEACKAQLLFNVCFGHPTVMFRKTVFEHEDHFYKPEMKQYSEEYDLWCRLVDKCTFANLPEPLVMYRTFSLNKKNEANERRRLNSFLIRKHFIKTQLGEQPEINYEIHDHLCTLKPAANMRELGTRLKWLLMIDELNKKEKSFSEADLTIVLAKWCFETYFWNTHLGLLNWAGWYMSNWRPFFSPNFIQHLKFAFRSMMKAKQKL